MGALEILIFLIPANRYLNFIKLNFSKCFTRTTSNAGLISNATLIGHKALQLNRAAMDRRRNRLMDQEGEAILKSTLRNCRGCGCGSFKSNWSIRRSRCVTAAKNLRTGKKLYNSTVCATLCPKWHLTSNREHLVQTLRDWDYIYSCVERPKDPFIVTSK